MDREQPLISIDVVALRFREHSGVEFALHTRPFEPYAGQIALPGVLLASGERLEDAALRALRDKTSIARQDVRSLTQFGVFDGTNRDPRGATISIGFIAVTDADEDDAIWMRLWEDAVPALPFDHDAILTSSFESAKQRLWSDWGFTSSLLANPFTTRQAIFLSRSLDSIPANTTQFSRWLASTGHVEKTIVQSGMTGRDTRWVWKDADHG